MKELLTAVKAELRAELDYVRDSDVFVAPHANFLPSGVRFPCVALKDGPIGIEELAGGMMRWSLDVNVVVYVQLVKDEASIMGDEGTGRAGVLDIVDDVHTALDENLLDITGMEAAYCVREQASELFADKTNAVQRKIVTYRYEKEGARP